MFVGFDLYRPGVPQVALPELLFEHGVDQAVTFAEGQHRVVGLIDHLVGDAGDRPIQHAFGLPWQVQPRGEAGLVGQVDFDFVRVAATTGDIGPGHLVDQFQARGAFGQGHQFLLKLRRVGGVRIGLGDEHANAHVVE
ncbi:hypothetical protein D3C86_1440370 [compost metagenome]